MRWIFRSTCIRKRLWLKWPGEFSRRGQGILASSSEMVGGELSRHIPRRWYSKHRLVIPVRKQTHPF